MQSAGTDIQKLAERVEKLEISNRRWKFTTKALLLSGVSLFLLGAKPADRLDGQVIRASAVEAREFLLKDDDGHVYASLSMNAGLKALQLNGLNGHVFIVPNQKTPGGGPALQFYDDKGNVVWTAPSKPELLTVR